MPLQPSEDKSPSNPVYSRRQDGYGAPLAPPVVAPPPPAPAPSYGPPPAPPPPAPPPAPTYGAPRPPPPPVLPPNVPPSAPGPGTTLFSIYSRVATIFRTLCNFVSRHVWVLLLLLPSLDSAHPTTHHDDNYDHDGVNY